MNLQFVSTQAPAKARAWGGIASLSAIHNRLLSMGDLSDRETDILAATLQSPLFYEPLSEIKVTSPQFILNGWACRARTLPDGRRQIFQLYIAGDLLTDRSRGKSGTSYLSLTGVKSIDAGALQDAVRRNPEEFPALAQALDSLDDETEDRLMGQILRTGRLRAHERLAHLTLELYRRHQRCGQTAGNAFPMPLTQEILADILGLSQVHINRMLQQLRHEGAVRTLGGKLEILDFEKLAALACCGENEP
ncbi:MAG: Crp/Fnr family transcriptional regulator [Alphaproteobacteria bacterium]|nr:Crp/Fnr family transcriptional regulator [Alphaproteobacteria bacterium]MBV9693870.1 Crp/Fnr family transcriptional regulator [Alphaproteobacteria bacterium]